MSETMPPLTSSEMRAWLTCQRGWWLRYYRRLEKTGTLPSLPNIGNLVHDALEAYYRDGEVNPLTHVKSRGDNLLFEYPELGEYIAKDVNLAAIMVEGYVDWVETTGADAGLEIVGAEVPVSAAVGPYELRGKIDARVRRLDDGALLQLEHKTVGNLTDIPNYAQAALQFLNYDLLAMLTKPDGVPTDGVVINMLRRVKRTATAKPPFYGRYEVRHNLDELRAHYRHVVAVGQQIEHARTRLDAGEDPHDVVSPHVNRSHGWSCDCKEITPMMDDGSDLEGFLSEFYREHDPYQRYQEGGE